MLRFSSFYVNNSSRVPTRLDPPVIALASTSDRGESNSDLFSNDSTPSLDWTLPFGTVAGNTLQIYINGSSHGSPHTLTANEVTGVDPIDFVLSALSDGANDITATITSSGGESNLSNEIAYVLDINTIGTPVVTGTSPTTDQTPDLIVTFQSPFPQSGDVLVLFKDGVAEGTTKVLGAGDLAITTITPASTAYGTYSWQTFVYRTSLGGFSAESAGYSQTIQAPAATQIIFLKVGDSSPWTVPTDWNDANNKIEIWGGGGGARSANGSASRPGGGGGAWSKLNNVNLTPSASVNFSVGAKGTSHASTPTAGGDSWLRIDGGSGAPASLSEGGLAKGGGAGGATSEGVGGASASGFGDVKNSGGTGGDETASGWQGGGGGGAGGPNGVGKAGGNGGATQTQGAGGGGGSDGGTVGANGATNGGAGGNNFGGTGSGAGATVAGDPGVAGTDGGGGGGAKGKASGTGPQGGNGGPGTGWTETGTSEIAGAGGGGGAGASAVTGGEGGTGGDYGGGAGGGGYGGAGPSGGALGHGAPGIIIITYTP